MSVAWSAPSTNTDGTKLGDLAGFRIYYGTSSGNYTGSVNVASPTTLAYTVTGLPSNTYYVVVKAYDTSSNESGPSVEVSKAIR